MVVAVPTSSLRVVDAAGETILDLDEIQGLWTAEQYLRLTKYNRHLIEFTNGQIEVLPMPTDQHQVILEFLFLALRAFLRPRGGKVLFAPLRLQIRPAKFREPALLLVLDANDPRRQ